MSGKPKTKTNKNGNKELSPATLMLGLGYDPVLSEGSLKPPIFLTSTFAFESAAAGKRFFEHITGKREGPADGLVYSRFNGPNQDILEDRLAVWDGDDDSLVFSRGMSATAPRLLPLVRQNAVISPYGPPFSPTGPRIDTTQPRS